MAELERAHALIGGDWTESPGPAIPVIDPYHEEMIGEVAESGLDLVDRAVAAATQAQPGWAGRDVDERARLLEGVAVLLDRDRERMAELVGREMGMPVGLARVTQAELPAAVLRTTADLARQFPWSTRIDGAVVHRCPAGVVAAITPWNMPVHQIVAKVAAALAAGCPVVLKPSEQTPFDANALVKLFIEAGCPPGVLNTVTGTGAVTGTALAGHPGLGHVSFTGSVAAGRTVAGLAARTLTRSTLELGGKSPAIILPDADLATAVAGAVAGGLVNSGQACNATTRMLVPAHLIGEVLPLVKDEVENYVLGAPADPATRQGPLASARQRDRVLAYISSAVKAGGTLVTGSAEPSEVSAHGYFVDPAVITGLPENAEAIREEIFGPVIAIQAYSDIDDAVRIANDCDFGLSAEVWSADAEHAQVIAARLHAGQVKINGVRTRDRLAVPFGGMKNSGHGRELGTYGIEEFTELRAVLS
ncbi:aldehyde dehydrogenase family protein [Nocardia jiangxiensis]|uniref:aldehyde dehydrogenase (NAD(+)) n=1 Tax=Nocardia jiangxiensis TaxID=282685 RepID=A0ABW6S9R3_9NOCA